MQIVSVASDLLLGDRYLHHKIASTVVTGHVWWTSCMYRVSKSDILWEVLKGNGFNILLEVVPSKWIWDPFKKSTESLHSPVLVWPLSVVGSNFVSCSWQSTHLSTSISIRKRKTLTMCLSAWMLIVPASQSLTFQWTPSATFVQVKSAFGMGESWVSPEQKAYDLSVSLIPVTRNQAGVIKSKEPLTLQWHSSKCTFAISL